MAPYIGDIYQLPPGTTVTPNTTIESSKYNTLVTDLATAQNTPRPVIGGGTGGATAVAGNDSLNTKGVDIASGTTTDLSAATGVYVNIIGTTTITSFGTAAAGVERVLTFTGILTLTYNATSLILPGAANLTTTVGDSATMRSLGGGNWRCVSYQRASGSPITNNVVGAMSITGSIAGTLLTVTSTDAGAGAAPVVDLVRDSASPAANDLLAYLLWTGRDSAANLQPYAQIHAQILDATSTSEDALWVLETVIAGAMAARLAVGAGIYTPAATGADKGADTINAGEYYKNGARLLLQRSFESTQQTITSGGALTLAHSLGASPKLYQAYLICTSAEAGYSVNDEVVVNPSIQDSGADRGLSMVPDATSLTIRFGATSTALNIIRKDNGVRFGITNTSWKLVVRAWL